MFINDRIFHMPHAFLVYCLGCSWGQPGEVAREKFVFPLIHAVQLLTRISVNNLD